MSKTVVIADDNLDCCKNIFNLIKEKHNNNIEIIGIAKDGEEAIEMIKKYNPDVILLDLRMPKKDGVNVLEEICKDINIRTKVIIISGETKMINRLNIVNSGIVTNIFIKPFDMEELYISIKNITKEERLDYKEIINELLHEFSFNFSSEFYNCLLIGIEKSLYKPLLLNDIYKEVAKEVKGNGNNIKWGIQKLISSMIRYTPKETIKKYFRYNNQPSAKLFISEMSKISKEKIEKLS